jgi:MFS family permease
MSNQPTHSLRYAWYVVAVLMLAYISSFIDRQVLALLVAPIKRDFHVTDTQISLLIGFSFAIFYTFLGIPIGRMADSKSRKLIIIIGITVWSFMTAICGLANTYWALFFARMGVGVGEAALSPAAYSMITDLFPKNKLGTAMGIYNVGVFLGSGLSILLVALIIKLVQVEGMWTLPIVGEIHPWQTVFFMVGLPGLIIVLLIWATVKEPVRQNTNQEKITNAEIKAHFTKNKAAILSIYFGIACMAMATYGATSWTPTSLMRSYGMKQSEAGIIFGLMVTIFSTGGVIAGGRYADYLSNKGIINGRLLVGVRGMTISAILSIILMTLIFITTTPPLPMTLVLCAMFCFFSSFPYAAATAALQEIVPSSMRGIFSAFYLFVVNLLGLGVGPMLAALINDNIFKTENTLMLSMTIGMTIASIISAIVLKNGLKPFAKSIEAQQS